MYASSFRPSRGEQTQRPTIQYEYESLSALAEAQEKLNENLSPSEVADQLGLKCNTLVKSDTRRPVASTEKKRELP